MPKGKRYILVEVDVNVVTAEENGGIPNNLTDDSQHCLDSMQADFEQYGYADGTHVYGVTLLHVSHLDELVLTSLHLQSCAKEIGALGKPCDRPDFHHDSDNLTTKQQLDAPMRKPGAEDNETPAWRED